MPVQIIKKRSFREAYAQLSSRVQKKVDGKIHLLAKNRAHRSLQVHRLRQARCKNIWICYIDINRRLFYQYKDGAIYLWLVGEHSIVDRIHEYRFE